MHDVLTAPQGSPGAQHPDGFDAFAALIRGSFTQALAWGGGHFFETRHAAALPTVYLDSFDDPVRRQYHNCSCCKSFLSHYGSLVVVNDKGEVRSAAFGFIDWGAVPSEFQPFLSAVRVWFGGDPQIARPAYSRDTLWGQYHLGGFPHFAVPNAKPFKLTHLSPGQHAAAQLQEFLGLVRSLQEFSTQTLATAVSLLETEALYRSDKFLGYAKKVLALKQAHEASPGNISRALMWKAVVSNQPGFGHVRSGVLGTLLEDIQAGMDYAAVKKRFDDKVDPLNYMRPQAAPTAGNIAQAEKLVETLGLTPSLERRYATVDELGASTWWTGASTTPQQATGGVFGALKDMNASQAQMSAGKGTMTWRSFKEKIAASASRISIRLADRAPLGAITAPVHPDAPPIFKWDDPANRNPFGWYRWAGARGADFGLGTSAAVTHIARLPATKNGGFADLEGDILILSGAADLNAAQATLGLYPEALRPELHQVRATIAAHSARNTLVTPPGVLACGLVVRKSSPIDLTLTVETRGVVRTVHIDRWE